MAIKVKGARDILGSLPKAPAATTAYDPARQTEGYLRRLEGAGVDVEKATDPRNLIERALNLRPNQNVLFDVFEIINRPQQALFGAFKAAQEGNNIGEAFLEGLSGEEETRFKDILVNAGLDSESFFTKALGFAGDVFLDPVDWAILPVTATLAGVDTLADAARLVKAQDLSGRVLNAAKASGIIRLKNADEIVDITKKGLAAQKLIDSGKVTKKAQRELTRYQKLQEIVQKATTETRGRSLLGLAAGGAKQGIVKVAGLTDEAVSRGLIALDKFNGIEFADESVRSFKELVLNVGRDADSFALGYYSLKNTLGGVFDIASKLPERVLAVIRKATGNESYTTAALEGVSKKVDNLVEEAAKAGVGGSTVEQVRKNLLNFFEWNVRKTPSKMKKLSMEELVTSGAPMNNTVFNRLKKILKKYNINLEDPALGQGIIQEGAGSLKRFTLSKGLRDKLIADIKKNPNLANTKFIQSTFYNRQARDLLKALEQDEAFMKLFNQVAPEYEKMQKALTIFQNQGKLEKFTEAGYARHVFNRDFEALQSLTAKSGAVSATGEAALEGIKYGNVQAIAERKWQMSALEANTIVREKIVGLLSDPAVELSDNARRVLTDLSGKEMFVESIQASMDDWIAEIPKLVKNAEVIDEILVKSIIKQAPDGVYKINPDDIIVINYQGFGNAIPRGYQEIKLSLLKQKLEQLVKVIDSPQMEKLLAEISEKGALANAGVAIDQHVYGMLNFIRPEPEKFQRVLRAIDAVNNQFKKLKLLSAGFHVRNFVGNFTNSMLVGMPVEKIIQYGPKADGIIKRGQSAIKKVLEAGGDESVLTAAERSSYLLFREFVQEGFTNISSEIFDFSADIIGKNPNILEARNTREFISGLLGLNNKANEYMDLRFRLGLYMYAKETPQLARNIGLETPGDVVRRALFDPKATSRAERETIKRLVPFYTFAKKNLAYQIRNIFDNPVQYNRLQKAVRGLWDIDGIDVDDIEDYKKENFWIPLVGLGKDGKYVAVKTNLPIGDLAEWFENPLVKGISSLGPLVRAPFELATGVQTFTGRPIQDFPGQKGYVFPNIPRNIEYLIGQTGADVPIAALRNIGATGAALLNLTGEDVTLPDALPSVFSAGDLARAQTGRDYDELARVRDLYAYYKQELGEIPTIAEIENKNNNQIKIASRLDGLLK